MSLPSKAVDRLFDRLAMTYGNEWARRWDGLDLQAVKSLWGYELQPFANRLESIAWALENLPPKAPNAIEFKQLCRMAPLPPEKQLPAPKADPARMSAELEKLRTFAKEKRASSYDHKAWAKVIMARHEAGEKVRPICVRFAREALRMHMIPEAA